MADATKDTVLSNSTVSTTKIGRLRNLTEEGLSIYIEIRDKLSEDVDNSWNKVNAVILELEVEHKTLSRLCSIEEALSNCLATYREASTQYTDFLRRNRSIESKREMDSYQALIELRRVRTDTAFTTINLRKQLLSSETSSKESISSKSSRTSSRKSSKGTSCASSTLARKRAKAEAARAKVAFTEKEAELRKNQAMLDESTARKKAEMQADIDMLISQKEAAAAEAELRVYEYENCRISDFDDSLPKVVEDSVTRTKKFVAQQAASHTSETIKNNTYLHADIPEFYPSDQHQPLTPVVQDPTSDITRFLLRKDLLFSRLSNFNDRPETYIAWKSSFLNIMDELQVTDSEQVDLLVKWLGSESSKHAVSIRTASANNPAKCLQRIWQRLEDRYGAPEMIEESLKNKLSSFPKLTNKDTKKLYELSDLVSEIESIKDNERMKSLFGHYDSSTGVTPIINKLPYYLQEKWTSTAVSYLKNHMSVVYPPFSHFAEFLREQSRIRNNPSFSYEVPQFKKEPKYVEKSNFLVKKTDTEEVQKPPSSLNNTSKCPLHQTDHSLNRCRAFRRKPMQERLKFLKDNKVCFRCCDSISHVQRECKKTIHCPKCNSDDHPLALHADPLAVDPPTTTSNHGGESFKKVSSLCTRICGQFPGKSCAKIVLCNVYASDKPDKVIRLYVMIDDQSNRTLGSPRLFDLLAVKCEETEYVLTSCSGKVRTAGRKINGIVLESLDQTVQLDLPTIIECNQMPDNRNEIPTPDVARSYSHLHDIAHHIPPIDENAHIILLIGRDVIKAHHVLDHRIGPANTPYAQKLPIGWVIIGESCLGSVHVPEVLNVNKTNVLENGRTTMFDPCNNRIKLQETLDTVYCDRMQLFKTPEWDSFGQNIFLKQKDDDKPGLSVDDRSFLHIMDASFRQDVDGKWSCPLPFREPRPRLQNNYTQVLKRANMLDKSLHKDHVKRGHFIAFMNKMLQNGHAEVAPPLQKSEECWYLPIFGVYHPRKQNQVRIVFDSAAKYNGICLNDVLLSGPDFTNSLLGILMRFRRESVAVIADIQQMFYCFKVDQQHRNYLRFLWHEENNIDKPLIEFRMCVHVFGNTASPAIATYGLRLAAKRSTLGSDVTNFVENDFYVDDGLSSFPTAHQATDLIKRTQEVLKVEGGLRLHKIVSNREEVMTSFPREDLATDLKDLPLNVEALPIQRSLGVGWNLESDMFLYHIRTDEQPFSKRGVLSTINSIFDPLGFLAPVVIEGKRLLRELINSTRDWDEPLPSNYFAIWDQWTTSLQELRGLRIPRTYFSTSFGQIKDKSIHIFSDASEKAIAAVGYVRAPCQTRNFELGFILGKAKLAPLHGNTIPRLELCAAVVAVEVAETISNHLNLDINNFSFYTDSKVVLGYIYNEKRRFFNYVANRVARIRHSTHPHQWIYTSTKDNPADEATRSVQASAMQTSSWLNGPQFLLKNHNAVIESFEVLEAESDKEVKSDVTNFKTRVSVLSRLGTQRFEKFSSWTKLVKTIARLKHVARAFKKDNMSDTSHLIWTSCTVIAFDDAEEFVIREVQREVYEDDFQFLSSGKQLPKSSSLTKLSPYIDKDGLMRIGGRLDYSNIPEAEKHPILVPGKHHIATLLIRNFHERVHHQGRHITEGVIRSAGYWITGAKSLISSIISKCVKCQKLRGTLGSQKMASLPSDRLEPGPPFTNVGVDCFGPWDIVTRRTRGGQASSKRWAVMFTCLTCRGVHIEVTEELSSSSFIMALRRFLAIRGPVKLFRSDRGTNFIGALDDIGVKAINAEDVQVKEFLNSNGAAWIFNPPHASHMGGVWERVIGITRRILDSILLDDPGGQLTHEMLVTFLAEASAIINSRPLVPLTSDPGDPTPLTPSLLLTQKPQQVTGIMETVGDKDIFKKQWKRVQILAEMFWNRWRTQYLQTLQTRRKWSEIQRNISCGDVVLVKDKQVARNMWPIGVVEKTYREADGLVRKCDIRVIRDGQHVVIYTRPIVELVLLIPDES
ncbi:uncharacterized protein LOC126832715 [Patella vulgata]|uniref:uncharacterized protein LOC126832715 n=1 Tax=Patella vulgata TaxID=6465 RepID=UPI00217F3069|nr:uncharacterized protein LOC126832715 [Patella vulgata]